MKKIVITHPTLGIYIGTNIYRYHFWTKRDRLDIDAVVAFDTIEQAQNHAKLNHEAFPENIEFKSVEADCGDGKFASIAACIKAGLDGWLESISAVGSMQ
ncbi:hypothetical protein ACI2KR_08855 [Pseudomonas luteola]